MENMRKSVFCDILDFRNVQNVINFKGCSLFDSDSSVMSSCFKFYESLCRFSLRCVIT